MFLQLGYRLGLLGRLHPSIQRPHQSTTDCLIGTLNSTRTGSFLVFHSKWFTGVVAFPIGLWWYVFLVLYPQSYRSYRLQEMEQRLNQNGARPEGGLDE